MANLIKLGTASTETKGTKIRQKSSQAFDNVDYDSPKLGVHVQCTDAPLATEICGE